MGQQITISSFIESIKKAGVVISNEKELLLRLTEVYVWQYALQTLAKNGKSLGISFKSGKLNRRAIHKACIAANVSEVVEKTVVENISK